MRETKEFKVGDAVFLIRDGKVFKRTVDKVELNTVVLDWGISHDPANIFHSDLEAHTENVRRHQQALNQATLAMAKAFPEDWGQEYHVFDKNGDHIQIEGWAPDTWFFAHAPPIAGKKSFDTPAEAIEAVIGGQE